MGDASFDRQFMDVKGWVKKSRELMISAHYLVAVWVILYSTGQDVPNLSDGGLQKHPYEAWKVVGDSATFLVALSLENALNGHLIKKGAIYLDNQGRVAGIDGKHDLSALVKKSDYSPDNNEEKSLRVLTCQLRFLGLAPAQRPRSGDGGEEWQKPPERLGSPVNYYRLANAIIESVLDGELRDLYFSSDGSYEHIPRQPEFSATPIRQSDWPTASD
ncbi:MAG: hypothetical protein R3292_10530 [Alcanivorax sp.]|nr:hypothetical protein [Alcanivorax sp.]